MMRARNLYLISLAVVAIGSVEPVAAGARGVLNPGFEAGTAPWLAVGGTSYRSTYAGIDGDRPTEGAWYWRLHANGPTGHLSVALQQDAVDLTGVDSLLFDWLENDRCLKQKELCFFTIRWGGMELFSRRILAQQQQRTDHYWSFFAEHRDERIDVSSLEGVGLLEFSLSTTNDPCNVLIDNIRLEPTLIGEPRVVELGRGSAGGDPPCGWLRFVRTDSWPALAPGLAAGSGFEALEFRFPVDGDPHAFLRVIQIPPNAFQLEDARAPGGAPWSVVAAARLEPVVPGLPDAAALEPGAAAAQARQLECAVRLGVPVEVANTLGMRFRLIPPTDPRTGFMMGTPLEEPDHRLNEEPRHRVDIEYPLWVGVCEVTWGEWDWVMGEASGEPADLPVEERSWDEARLFLDRLNALAGGGYRLLSEAEWEYACRAGTDSVFYFPPEALDQYAWHKLNSGESVHPAGTRLPNAWGLHDCIGNVWEYVEDDWYHETNDYEGVPADGSPWIYQDEFGRWGARVKRGGGCGNEWRDLRSGTRSTTDPTEPPDPGIGFRIARDFVVP